MEKKIRKFQYNVVLIMVFSGLCYNIKAQSFIGFLADNYAGVNSVIANPATSVDSRFKVDVHLGGISAFGGNDYYNLNVIKAIKNDGYDFENISRYTPKMNNNGEANIDVMGPSFMFNINSANSIAIVTRARSFLNINGINGNGLYAIGEDNEDFIVNQDDFNGFSQAWAEIGLSYARVLINEKENFLKGGVTAKYLKGGGSVFAAGRNISINYDADGSLHSNGGTTGSVTSEGHIILGRFEDFERDGYEYELPKRANGLGLDLGIVYEWRPNHGDYKPRKVWPHRLTFKDQNKYKLKLGMSITDIGYINYRNGLRDLFNITNTNVSEELFDSKDGIYDVMNNIYALMDTSVGYRAILPTAFHFNVDWNFDHRFYLNFNTDLSLTTKNRLSTSTITDIITITPRYESKWFSFYLPFSVMQYAGFQMGAGFRAGPLYMGSNSLLTNLISEKSTGANFYAGLKVPIFHGPIE